MKYLLLLILGLIINWKITIGVLIGYLIRAIEDYCEYERKCKNERI